MAISQSHTPPGMLQQALGGLTQGAAQSLGRQGAEAVGGIIGAGAQKLGKAVGIGEPDNALLDMIIAKGYAKDRAGAKQWLKLNPRAQQADITANAAENERTRERERAGKEVKRMEEEQGLGPEGKQMPQEFDLDDVKMASDPNVPDEQIIKNMQAKGELEDEESERKAYENEPVPKPRKFLDPRLERQRALARGEKESIAQSDFDYTERFQKPLRDEVNASYKKSREDVESAEREKSSFKKIYNIEQKEGLPSTEQALFIRQAERALGLNEGDMNAMLGASAEEITKILADTVKDAKQYFGPRMTDFDLQSWFKKFPSLLNSPEGRLRVLGDLYTFAELKELHGKAIQDVVKKAGYIPENLEEIVDVKIRKQRNKLLDKFENGESNLPGYEKNLKKAARQTERQREGGKKGGLWGGIGGAGLGAIAGGAGGAVAGSKWGTPGMVLGGLGGAVAGGYQGAKHGYSAGSALGSQVEPEQGEHPAFEAYRKAGKSHLIR